MSDALPHPPTAVAEAVAKYRPRRLGPSTQDGTHARVATGAATSRVPPLTLLCLDAVTKNFQLYPSMDGMDPKFTAAITATLPLDMDVLVSGPHVHDEHYWRRVCTEGKKWQNCQIAQHGMSWKQLFFETYVGEALEGFGNYGDLPKGHEEDFLRPPIDSKHPKWKVMYPEVPAKLPPAGILPARERFCSRGIDCDGVRVMASPNSGWPALERLKSTTQPIVQSYADSYAWATVSGADIAAAKAASAAADATVVSTLTGTKFGGAGAPSTSHGPRRGAAASEFNLAHMIDVCAAGKAAGVDGNVLREYLTPDAVTHFQVTGQWPAETGLCILCARARDLENLAHLLKAAEDYVFTLVLQQLPSHLDLEIVFARLPNLISLEVQYGVKNLGMKYDRSMFGMKITDAMSLSKCCRATESLASLSLPCCMIDDDLVRMLMTGLIRNQTVTRLDLSHNSITNYGVRLLSKLMGPKSVLASLSLADNHIHSDGGKYLGRALKRSESLTELNVRLNRLDDEGGRMVLDGLRSNVSLTSLNLSSNSLRVQSAEALGAVLSSSPAPLASLDISGNGLDARSIALVSSSLRGNTCLTHLDCRANEGLDPDSPEVAYIRKVTRENELAKRK